MPQLAGLEDRNGSEVNTLTPVESAAKDIIFESIEKLWAISVAKILASHRQKAEAAVHEKLRNLESWLSAALASFDIQIRNMFPLTADLRIPTWHYFHEIHVLLDVCYFTHATLDIIDSQLSELDIVNHKVLAESSTRIRQLVAECFTCAHQAASKVQGGLKQGSAASEVIKAGLGQRGNGEDPIGVELRKTIGVPWMERFGANLRESWVEALDGIAQVRAP